MRWMRTVVALVVPCALGLVGSPDDRAKFRSVSPELSERSPPKAFLETHPQHKSAKEAASDPKTVKSEPLAAPKSDSGLFFDAIRDAIAGAVTVPGPAQDRRAKLRQRLEDTGTAPANATVGEEANDPEKEKEPSDAASLAKTEKTEASSETEKSESKDGKTKKAEPKMQEVPRPWYGDMLYASFTYLLPMLIVASIVFELTHRAVAYVDWDLPIDRATSSQSTRIQAMFAGMGRLCWPYFGEERRSKNYLGVLLTISLLSLAAVAALNLFNKDFWDAIDAKDQAKFGRLLITFVVIILSLTFIGVYMQYIKQMLYIDWRNHMTRRFQAKWLQRHAMYRMQILYPQDNPDQRLEQDIHFFCESTLNIGFSFVSAFGTLLVFLPILLMISPTYAFGLFYCPGWLVYLAIIYALGGTLLTHVIGKELIYLGFTRQQYSADYRSELLRIRDGAESVALYRSEETEDQRLDGFFERVKRVWWEYMKYSKRLQFFRIFYGHISTLFPYFVLTPSYFNGEITLGTMFQVFHSLAVVINGFEFFINAYDSVVEWRATADRLVSFDIALDRTLATADTIKKRAAGVRPTEELVVTELDIWLPDETRVWTAFSMILKQKESVLISGCEGGGKSLLFRSIAGVWPLATDGAVDLPEGCMFVPQRSYVPAGKLKAAICYPEPTTAYDDDVVEAALVDVGLAYLMERQTAALREKPTAHAKEDLDEDVKCIGLPSDSESSSGTGQEVIGLEREDQWKQILSPGEQQRLGIAHVLLVKPKWLFLDESTSALERDSAIRLYRIIAQRLPDCTVVSISHDVETLVGLHSVHYELVHDGAKGGASRLERRN